MLHAGLEISWPGGLEVFRHIVAGLRAGGAGPVGFPEFETIVVGTMTRQAMIVFATIRDEVDIGGGAFALRRHIDGDIVVRDRALE